MAANTTIPITNAAAQTIVVSGRVFSPNRAGGGGLSVELADKNLGADTPLVTGVTDEHGSYSLQAPAAIQRRLRKDELDLQVRVSAWKTFLGASEVRYNASASEVINVVLPASASVALPSEHESLTGSIAARYKDKLSELNESYTGSDIVYLTSITGWGPALPRVVR